MGCQRKYRPNISLGTIYFEGGLNLLYEPDDETVIWLESTVTAHTHTRLTALFPGLPR